MRRQPSDIKQLIIHCSASLNGVHHSAAEIDAWHKARGFQRRPEDIRQHEPGLPHIGYHYVIYVNGALTNGRHELEIGAHCQGHNKGSVGVCLIGTDKFTPAQWSALRGFVQSFRKRHPEATIHGHREYAAKSCPGFDVHAWIEKGMPNGLKGHTCDAVPAKAA
jgi:N-acetylmuramoyl-L-alanine amidase